MTKKVTIKTAELKAHLSAYLRRANRGERVIVCDRETPVAELGPVHKDQAEDGLARLVAEGRATLAKARALERNPFRGIKTRVDAQALLDEIRGDR